MKNKKIKNTETDQVTSPEELDAYIRIAHPGVWLGLGAIVALLVGTLCWCFIGRIEVQVNSISYVSKEDSSKLITYIHYKEFKDVSPNQTIRLEDGREIILNAIDSLPLEIRIDEDIVPLEVRSKGNWTYGDIIYVATSDNSTAKINNGTYSSVVITGSMSPMSFVIN